MDIQQPDIDLSRRSIRRLSEHTVNRIAAGEVIERPAAVVKELVENSLDAGAGRVIVLLDRGGIDRIEVIDDGCGISPSDLPLALERHCTSKLMNDDLVHVRSLGFRGEALPSIGSVARLSLTSRVKGGGDGAWVIRVEAGHKNVPEPSSGPVGTRVVMQDLFFATPARRKFLKSARIEASHAEAVLRRLALSASEVAFRLQMDNRVIFDLPAQERRERVESILRLDNNIDGLLAIEATRGDMKLSGYACSPAVHRSTANGQIIVVNGRSVLDPALKVPIRVAYRHTIEHGRHPVVALFLELPPELVDVNVHPSKTEVRFAQPDQVKGFIIATLSQVLDAGAGRAGVKPTTLIARSRQRSFSRSPSTRREGANWGVGPAVQSLGVAEQISYQGGEPRLRSFEESTLPNDKRSAVPSKGELTQERESTLIAQDFPLGAAAAQVLDTYILSVSDDGSLVIIDQHAAHERLMHEKLRAQYLEGNLRSQRLLLPEVVHFPSDIAHYLVRLMGTLSVLGIEIEPFGGNAILVRAMPALFEGVNATDLLRDMAEEMMDDETSQPVETATLLHKLDNIIARMACHGSIRAGRKMTIEEMNILMRQMETTPRSGTCSHGRPTWIKLTRKDIETMFGRR